MSVEAQKLEVIEWILKVKDASTIKKLMKIKNRVSVSKPGVRKFGGGKGIFTYDEPLPEFKEYMK